MKQYYISEYIKYCYPYDDRTRTTKFGVLEKYIGKMYSREEIDEIICEKIKRHPYIDNAMYLEINIMRSDKWEGFYHMLKFKNDNYKNQERIDTEIKYEL